MIEEMYTLSEDILVCMRMKILVRHKVKILLQALSMKIRGADSAECKHRGKIGNTILYNMY